MISFFMAFIIFECLIIGYLAYILDSFGVRTARKKKQIILRYYVILKVILIIEKIHIFQFRNVICFTMRL